jgi:hypothetical protein
LLLRRVERYRKKPSEKRRAFANMRKQKMMKAEKELAKELKEVESTVNSKTLAHNQTQILSQVFAIYFRVLKFAAKSELLGAVLEGLGRFAHLIDTSFYTVGRSGWTLICVTVMCMRQRLTSIAFLYAVPTGSLHSAAGAAH